jgi:tetratricopeptide (TPR) repeat protein
MNWLDTLGWNENHLDDIRFIGYCYLKQGHYENALLFFRSLIILSQENAYDLQTLGALYLQKGDNLQALEYLDRALKLDPNNENILINRIKALFSLGYKSQAIFYAKALQKAKKNISDQASALLISYT